MKTNNAINKRNERLALLGPIVDVRKVGNVVDDAFDDNLTAGLVGRTIARADPTEKGKRHHHNEPCRHERIAMHGAKHRHVLRGCVLPEFFVQPLLRNYRNRRAISRRTRGRAAYAKYSQRKEKSGEVPRHRPPRTDDGERHRGLYRRERFAANYLRRTCPHCGRSTQPLAAPHRQQRVSDPATAPAQPCDRRNCQPADREQPDDRDGQKGSQTSPTA